MKTFGQMRNALTMIELIFVIVILGIVASIGAEIIAQTYESYIVQRAQYRATMKTELALSQIANRLRYAIPGTVMAENSGSLVSITDINSTTSNLLQWVAYDGDSFEAIDSSGRQPGWSGFCDIDASSNSAISTPGSNLGLASTIITNLGGSLSSAVLYFPDGSSYAVNGGSGESITLGSTIPSGSRIFERYKLAWSSYALSVESGDLYLYYNFNPTVGTPLGSNKSLLLKDVTNFRFKGSEGALRIKICKEEQIGINSSDTIHACKEKVIF
jgi:prepilin-type N-terminal cleavage/methylation domain-containing protein